MRSGTVSAVYFDADLMADDVCKRLDKFGIMWDQGSAVEFIGIVLEINAWFRPRDRIKQIKSASRTIFGSTITADETMEIYEFVGVELTRLFNVVTVNEITEISYEGTEFRIIGDFTNEI